MRPVACAQMNLPDVGPKADYLAVEADRLDAYGATVVAWMEIVQNPIEQARSRGNRKGCAASTPLHLYDDEKGCMEVSHNSLVVLNLADSNIRTSP